MDIKLRARLSAYAKVDSIGHLQTFIPDPTNAKDGTVLGVDTGKYTLFPSLDNTDIDKMFEGSNVTVVDKDQIDELFKDQLTEPESVTKSEIDKLFEESTRAEPVDKDTIDQLFPESETEPESVTKEEIDDLFEETSTDTTGTVSFADIDKLFS